MYDFNVSTICVVSPSHKMNMSQEMDGMVMYKPGERATKGEITVRCF